MTFPTRSPSFNVQDFLKKHWSKSPVFLPKLVSIEKPISPEELAGLACEQFVESQLITNYDQLVCSHGPFSEEKFLGLPEEDWTLLVQSVDLYIDEIKALKSLFKFLPSWLLDNVMVSYAVPGGSVGLHFDHYDVFLVQGEGTRLWRVGEKCDSNTVIETSSGLNLLQDTELAEEFLLEQGDALYVPAHYAHWGEAITNSLCYSIGFRAPSQSEMIEGFSETISSNSSEFERFINHPNQQAFDRPSKISNEDLLAAFEMTQSQLNNYSEFCKWFGSYMTLSRFPDSFEEHDKVFSLSEIRRYLTDGMTITFNPASRRAYCELPKSDSFLFFVDGKAYKLGAKNMQLVSELCDIDCCLKTIILCLDEKDLAPIILDLVSRDCIQFLAD